MNFKHRNWTQIIRNAGLVLVCFVFVEMAFSASFSSGGKRKDAKKATVTTFDLRNKPLSLHNGFHFKGGLSLSNNKKGALTISNTIRYQKGNTIYVVPYKNESFIHKLRVPQKGY